MWGHEKLKDWVREYFAMKGDVQFDSRRYWELRERVDALYEHFGLEYKEFPRRCAAVDKEV